MVKLSNRGKGKPSKRKTLKTKYKIQRKVRQHKKKLRKQMRKLSSKNIKPRKGEQNNTLPNSFPFKAQILQYYKKEAPLEGQTANQRLDSSEWGLIALENNNVYLAKDKDHLTKKYITSYQKIWSFATLIIETVDARNLQLCLSTKIQEQIKNKKLGHLVVVCKIDTVADKKLNDIKKSLDSKKMNYCLFTTDPKKKNILLEQIVNKINQYPQPRKVIVLGKGNTGKHTLIKQFMKLTKFHNEDYSTINRVDVNSHFSVLDTPFRTQDQTGYPLFQLPTSASQQSIALQEQRAIRYLFIDNIKNKNGFIMHYGIQDFNSIDDLLKKVGKVRRMFGKGGMVNTSSVRTNILSDWYQGKLNYIFE